jgi:hypothetical protein
VSPVDIVNISLAEGATRAKINGFPPIDTSPPAVAAGLFYTPKLRMLLRSAPWDVARTQSGPLAVFQQAFINGQPSTNPPPQPWQWAYLPPPDMLRARFILQFQQPAPNGVPFTTGPQNVINAAYANTRVPFVIANSPDPFGVPRKVILTNMANAMLVYTADISQYPDMWDAMFTSAATAVLASFFIANLSGDKALMGQQIQAAKGMLDSARAMNASESMTDQSRIASWTSARWNAGSGYGVSYGSGQAFYNGAGWDSCEFPGGIFY